MTPLGSIVAKMGPLGLPMAILPPTLVLLVGVATMLLQDLTEVKMILFTAKLSISIYFWKIGSYWPRRVFGGPINVSQFYAVEKRKYLRNITSAFTKSLEKILNK